MGSNFTSPLLAWADPNTNDGSPSAFANGIALADPRPAFAYQNGGANWGAAFAYLAQILAIDATPSAIAAANIAPAQVPVAAAPLNLVAVSGAGITVSVQGVNALTGVAFTAMVIDGQPARSAGAVQVWAPATLLARNVRITSVGNDSGATFLVSGYDVYGYPMSERITGANAGVASGKKAFSYIASVVPSGAVSGANVSVGTGDVYGFPMAVTKFAYVDIYWNGALITSATGFLAADVTNPATPTTGDVRGTYAVQSASDGTKQLQVFITPIGTSVTSLFGQTQA